MKTDIEKLVDEIKTALHKPGNHYKNIGDVCDRYVNPKSFTKFKIGQCLEVHYDRSMPYHMQVNHRSPNGQGWMMQMANVTPNDLRQLADFVETR